MLVGVGEPLELRLVDTGQECGVYGGQLDGLVCEGGVKIAHIHRIFLQMTNEMKSLQDDLYSDSLPVLACTEVLFVFSPAY